MPETSGWSVEKLTGLLEDWFTGRSPELLYHVANSEMKYATYFEKKYFDESLEYLRSYYVRVFARQQRMQMRFQPDLKSLFIGQNELDDLYVKEGS